ncbi:DNA-binding transcriptional regulator, MarR family [Pseudonocardia thermophila]|uniref:DNA-binding transcriptional regulator, MarR family n=1 Tax=Pseudonocardia thermophila TaxID=1848 RepID=A0A1M6N610_PSETH|nr:MarR family transcriptional regulator [Pseudonocardia thermophila]SHJ91053.1 DNA-binding transcriptional regulator, MarR family [Pseudonocardia thermophila]
MGEDESSAIPEESAGSTAGSTLSDLFRSVARRLRRATAEALAPYDITPSQARALGVLRRDGDMRAGALAARLGIAARSATDVLDALAARGWAERVPDPADRRATVVRLTPAGRELGEAIRAARAAEAESFFAGLDEADRAELRRILLLLAG